jgi:ankyrin repeat protein
MKWIAFATKLILIINVTTLSYLQMSIAAEPKSANHYSLGLYESLLSAIEMDSDSEVRQFITFGANINYRYKDGKTPLMLASSMGSIRVVHALLELGADMHLVSKENKTALDYAYFSNDYSIINALQISNTKVEPSSNKQLVFTIQFYLNRLGYIAGNVDGIYGKKTRTSLEQFSKDYGQMHPIEISERQIEILFNAMANTDTKKSVDFKDQLKSENKILDNISQNTENELVISEPAPSNINR